MSKRNCSARADGPDPGEGRRRRLGAARRRPPRDERLFPRGGRRPGAVRRRHPRDGQGKPGRRGGWGRSSGSSSGTRTPTTAGRPRRWVSRCSATRTRSPYAESDTPIPAYMDLSLVEVAPVRWIYPALLKHWDGGAVRIDGIVSEGDEIAGFKVDRLPGPRPRADRALARDRTAWRSSATRSTSSTPPVSGRCPRRGEVPPRLRLGPPAGQGLGPQAGGASTRRPSAPGTPSRSATPASARCSRKPRRSTEAP